MLGAVQPVLHWIYTGLRERAAMVWMTWWPLVLGFTLSGFVQSFLPRDGRSPRARHDARGPSRRRPRSGVWHDSQLRVRAERRRVGRDDLLFLWRRLSIDLRNEPRTRGWSTPRIRTKTIT
jgi:hypothetical protein